MRASTNNLSEKRTDGLTVVLVRPDAFAQAACVVASSFAQLSGVEACIGLAIAKEIAPLNIRFIIVAGKVVLRMDHLLKTIAE